MSQVERYTVSMDGRLLERFDELIAGRGYANRSEGIRDLIRAALVEDEWEEASGKVAATVTLVFDHHTRELFDKLTEIQHHHAKTVVASTHVHLDNDNCLEVIILRGECNEVKKLAQNLVAIKGIKHGKAVFTTEGKELW